MLVLVSYDVNTESAKGRARLRKIAKICLKYGLRVQHSVFECQIDSTQKTQLKDALLSVADLEKDSIRLYQLGNTYRGKVEHYGVKETEDLKEDVILV